ncbi:MAG: PepSY domain-containing protein, partial [Vicinamibacterales bacterium]
PRNASWTQFRQVLLFRRGLGSKARDFNWHNVIGIWSAVPLFVVVLGGVVISYPWAGDLVYAAFGEAPPPRLRPGGPPPGGGPGAGPAGRRGPGARPGNATRPAPGAGPGDEAGRGPGAGPGLGPRAGGRGGQRIDAPLDPAALEGVDRAFEAARRETPSWRTLSVRLPASTEQPLTIAIDTGTGGQPQFRSTLTVNQATGQIEREERYADQSAGRRARSWLRFAHTGEVYGLLGQTVAGAVSLGGAVLVWTGLALALRRFANWRARGRNGRALRAA